MVDVDLGADAADRLPVELDGEAGAADRAALDGALADQAALDELSDEAGDRGLVEAEVGGEPGP